MEAIKSLNEPTGSHITTIANYIEVRVSFFCFFPVLDLYVQCYAYK